MGISDRGRGYGLAAALGFPLALVTFLAWSGELVGFESAERMLHPALAVPGFILAGVGLYGLHERLDISFTGPKISPIAMSRLGVALGLAGVAGTLGPTENDYFAGFTLPAAFVVLTLGLANLGLFALRHRSFGALSFVPLSVVASIGLWFLSLFPWVSGGYHTVAQASALVVQVALWLVLGVLVGTDPHSNTKTVGEQLRSDQSR